MAKWNAALKLHSTDCCSEDQKWLLLFFLVALLWGIHTWLRMSSAFICATLSGLLENTSLIPASYKMQPKVSIVWSELWPLHAFQMLSGEQLYKLFSQRHLKNSASQSPDLPTCGSIELHLFCSIRKFNTKGLVSQLMKENQISHPQRTEKYNHQIHFLSIDKQTLHCIYALYIYMCVCICAVYKESEYSKYRILLGDE